MDEPAHLELQDLDTCANISIIPSQCVAVDGEYAQAG